MPRVTITVPEKTAQPYRFQLDRKVVTLGRGDENDIMIDSGSVSAHHAEMHRIEGGYELRDAGSTNGIKLDGDRFQVLPLRSGMTAHIGDVAFDFLLSDEERAVLASEKSTGVLPVSRESDLPPAPAPPPRQQVIVTERTEGSGFAAVLVFLILAAAAFFAGLAVRFQKETGGSFFQAIANKPAQSAPANLAPADEPAVNPPAAVEPEAVAPDAPAPDAAPADAAPAEK